MLAAPWLELKLAVPRWKLALAQVAGGVWPTLAMGNELRSSDTTRDPAARERWADDPLAHHVATPRWFNEVRAAQAYILGHPDTLRVPTLIAVPGDDRIVNSERTLAFARAAGATVDVKVYPEAYHELFLEPDWRTDRRRLRIVGGRTPSRSVYFSQRMSHLVAYFGNEPENMSCALFSARSALYSRSSGKGGEAEGWSLGFIQGGDVLLQKRPRANGAEIDLYSLAHDLKADAMIGRVGLGSGRQQGRRERRSLPLSVLAVRLGGNHPGVRRHS